ncbi:SusD/RagB family nutrient-binding outer membrane lipoprotein [Capnocytophaga canis]|uniref:SusD/RagB family nutrient-binding outer membrane lipoprotein n=1 Tax=Capnocytophaga canis TaxID=1848903 RepID=UPI001561C08E|nr:SusD/RagB family nutrient-binding outer membrane lipoprotein [Capnocytophaga canis]
MKKIYTLLVGGLVALSSCNKDFEEINTNPNSPDAFISYAVFNSANKSLMDGTRGAFSSGRVALQWVQYSAQTNYTEEDRYQYRPASGDNLWATYYLRAQDYKTIIDLNTSEKTKGEASNYGENENQIAAARIMLAYIFSNLADTFGNVPYYSYGNNDPEFQALDSDKVLTPVYVSQQKIYTDILKELKEAAEMVVGGDSDKVFTKGDALFGSVGKMKRFANSLRLRIANRVKNVPALSTIAQTHITEAIAGGVMQSNDDTVGLTYENNKVAPSPMYTAFFIDSRVDFASTNSFVELLKGERGSYGVDPRLQKYVAPRNARIRQVRDNTYAESDNLADYVGMPYGLPNAYTGSQMAAGVSFFSSNVLKPDYTEVLMEYAEVCFLLSENNGWDDAWYKKGVEASMERWGVDGAKSATFVAGLTPANEENVITQKYIALYMQPYEAWSEYRRTGFPNVLNKVGQTYNLVAPVKQEGKPDITSYVFNSLVQGITDLPARLLYSARYSQLNKENYEKAIQNMGMSEDSMTHKLIWAK